MAKATSDTDTTIEDLLQQRAQYEQWLSRLESAADRAPAAVRQRVRGDYEARLRGVIEQLRGHAATITEELERHRATQADLEKERRQAEDELAEAEIRHTVGEYTEEEWSKINDDSQNRLERLRSDLGGVGDEINRLSEVQSLISTAPPKAESAAPKASAPEQVPEPLPAPPKPAPRAQRAPDHEPEPAPPPSDELAFLKSVSEEERKPAARRVSNPGTPTPPPSPRPSGSAPPAPSRSGGAGAAKTLKCGECGTLNRPTEWYCERCGAELAGV